jgi:simple sugar transport system permease protein
VEEASMNEVVDFLGLVVTAMVPFILVSQGTMLSGRAGIFNVSQEGMMVLGAAVGFLVSLEVGSNALGLLVAGIAGAVFGFVLAWTTTYLRLDQFVIGLALFFAALGTASLLYRVVIGVTLTPPLIPTLRDVDIPVLSDLPFLGPVLFQQDLMVYAAFALSVGLWWFLYRTDAGMRLRSVGENPKAADSLGINVFRTRMVAGMLGSALMALGGAYLPMVYTGTYTEGIVGGRGWLAIALTFFGGWRPQYIVAGAAFFAGMDVLALRAQVAGIGVPHQFVLMLPYVATLLVMVLAFRWARVPAFLGLNYDRESRLVG